jgi:hypothetical protein
MNQQDLKALKAAAKRLENTGLGAKIVGMLGTPIEKTIALLPDKTKHSISSATQKAIHGALRLSLKTLNHHDPESGVAPPKSSDGWHKAATATTGAMGGAFGMLALTIELPISTTIMMRSIADVARSEGADMQDLQTQLECVQVLTFGGSSGSDEASEIGYFIAREAMTKAVTEAAAYIAKNGLQKGSAPAIVRLIAKIAERYSIIVTEKAAAQAIPIIGAIGGAIINTIFINHFQNMAHGHFTIRRLERKYTPELVRQKYSEFLKEKG